MKWDEWKPILIVLGALCVMGLVIASLPGCGGPTEKWTQEDVAVVRELGAIAKEFGPRARASLRTGRPFVAGIINGVIVIPGTEIDVDISADPVRSETTNAINPVIVDPNIAKGLKQTGDLGGA